MSSAYQPQSAYQVTATLHWRVTWAGGGQGGVYPDLTTVARVRLRVAEVQALVVGSGAGG